MKSFKRILVIRYQIFSKVMLQFSKGCAKLVVFSIHGWEATCSEGRLKLYTDFRLCGAPNLSIIQGSAVYGKNFTCSQKTSLLYLSSSF